MNYAPHPRLCFSTETYQSLRLPVRGATLSICARRLEKLARSFLAEPEFRFDEGAHNWHVLRAREAQRRVMALLVQYKRSGDIVYRAGLLDYIRQMDEWSHWMWGYWRQGLPDAPNNFDLSCGENSLTLAFAYDALANELDDEETALFVRIATLRSLRPYLETIAERPDGSPNYAWWHTKPDSNWNTVCNGGAGILAMAMAEHFAQADEVLALAERGFAAYFGYLGADGAWPEGLAYWNYGMRYAFYYLLSRERASGEPHPLLSLPASSATLRFPLVFSPNDQSCGFGDGNGYNPLPFHFLAAARLRQPEVARELALRFETLPETEWDRFDSHEAWSFEADLMLCHTRTSLPDDGNWPSLALMQGLEWGYVADAMPRPKLYAAVRGGTIDAPHTHRDLLSFFVVAGREKPIDNITEWFYKDSTFSDRREELYEISEHSKNTVLINGVGIGNKTAVRTEVLDIGDFRGFRMDATAAMLLNGHSQAAFCARLLLMIRDSAILVVDRIVPVHPGLVESRLHTFFPVEFGDLAATIRGRESTYSLAFAASRPSVLRPGMGLQNDPRDRPDTLLRHHGCDFAPDITFACLLVPNGEATLLLKETGETTELHGTGSCRFHLTLTGNLLDPRTD